MMQFHIGDSTEYIAVQYAKSARSACRECKQKIGKDELRIGLFFDDDHYAASYWYHTDCFHFKPRHKQLDVETLDQMIYGIEDLNPEDVSPLLENLKEQLKDFQENKYKKTKKSKTIKADKKQAEKKQPEKIQNKKTRKSKSRSKSESVQPEIQAKVKKQKKGKKAFVKQKRFITAAQVKQYKELLDEYLGKNANELKQILGKNGQPKSGNKSELAAKCADGKQFGKIPYCSSCGGGKLRFNREKGTYKCPGFMEDTDFVDCKASFTIDQVIRQQWTE